MADLVVYEGKLEESAEALAASLVDYTSEDAKQYIIEDEAGFKEAGDIINQIRAISKQYEELEKSFTAGALETVETIRAFIRPRRQLAMDARKLWDQKARDYVSAKQLQQQEVHRALQEGVAKNDPKAVNVALAKLEEKPHTDNISVVPLWKWRVLNRDIVPTQFTTVDEKAVNTEMRRQLAQGPAAPMIAGIQFYQENSIRGRG